MILSFKRHGNAKPGYYRYFLLTMPGQPEEGFVYLENKGNFKFDAFTLEQSISGRWLTMDAGDLDGDGKMDIVLGNFSVGPALIKSRTDWRTGPPFILLKNVSKQ